MSSIIRRIAVFTSVGILMHAVFVQKALPYRSLEAFAFVHLFYAMILGLTRLLASNEAVKDINILHFD